MSTRRNWSRAKPQKPTEAARPLDEGRAGPWSHVPREPVRVLSEAEKRAFLASRPDLTGDR
jgi:hypothetical protein